ncbi:MAG: hypothetical protein ABWZ26_02485 [Candidatus Nanopelagicales bacterium]
MTVGPAITVLRVDSSDECRGLAAYMERLVDLDPAAAVRLQSAGPALGVWSGPPMSVVALRPVALAEPLTLDVTVGAARLLDVVRSAIGSRGFALPPAVPGPPWAGLLPPRVGWEAVGEAQTSEVSQQVERGVVSFRERTELVEQASRDRSTLLHYADEVWERPVVADVPLRAAHAASLLGFLGPTGVVAAYRTTTWWRLQCPGGSVAVRRPDVEGLGLFFG